MSVCAVSADGLGSASVTSGWSSRTTCSGTGGTNAEPTNGTTAGSAPEACATGGLHAPTPARRQKSYDELDPSAMASARTTKGSQLGQMQARIGHRPFQVFCENLVYFMSSGRVPLVNQAHPTLAMFVVNRQGVHFMVSCLEIRGNQLHHKNVPISCSQQGLNVVNNRIIVELSRDIIRRFQALGSSEQHTDG